MTTTHNKTLVRTAGAAMALALAAAPALAEVFTKEELIKANKEAAGGGKGTLIGEYAFTRDKALKDHAIKEISWLTLQPGDSIGYHKHTTNEDTYIIVSGRGTFRDKDGKDVAVKPGDVTIVRKGESHGLVNTGTEPLVFVDVIAEQ
ncbi:MULTISPECIES: cupin domain-containing protein [Acidovorax]|uniref:cupin domain-containing protein n=1 Tax=Acidovorax TaxID=12916 RepID=UPI0002F224A4|nr:MULTISPECIES: cupin domain-containing protein [Acidovorax]